MLCNECSATFFCPISGRAHRRKEPEYEAEMDRHFEPISTCVHGVSRLTVREALETSVAHF